MSVHVPGLHDLKIPEHARAFFDPEKTRRWVHESAVDGLTTHLNKQFTLKEQKQATMDRHDLTQPIKGTIELVNKKTGEVVDTKKNVTLCHIPWVTDRNTVVYNGSEYNITSQQRLKPGVYTRVKDTGDIEAHVNVKAGTGSGGKVIFFPDKALFIYQVGTTRIKLYGLLHGLGVPDSEMETAWGKEIYLKNKMAYEGNELEKMHDKIFTFQSARPVAPSSPATGVSEQSS